LTGVAEKEGHVAVCMGRGVVRLVAACGKLLLIRFDAKEKQAAPEKRSIHIIISYTDFYTNSLHSNVLLNYLSLKVQKITERLESIRAIILVSR